MSSKANNLEKDQLKRAREGDLSNKLKDKNGRVLKIMTQIHFLLLNHSNLTNEKKLSYCEGQRYLMKKYLKRILNNL